MTEPVLPGARGPRPRQEGDGAPATNVPQPLFGASRKGVALEMDQGAAPAAVLAATELFPPDLDRQLAQRADGPRLAAVLAGLFPVRPGREDVFASEALQVARAVQERAAALTAEIAERDLNGRLGRLTDSLMAQAAPGLLERARRALGSAPASFDAEAASAQIEALRRELKIVLPPAERLAEQAAPALDELVLARDALQVATPWLDAAAASRRVRLLEATHAGCSLVPAQARQLVAQLREHADRLETLESATLPAVRNMRATRRLAGPGGG